MDFMRRFHFSTFPPIVAPIYYGERSYAWDGGSALICIPLSDVGLPAVILNLVRDDLRMMAPNAVVSREGGMKYYGDGCEIYVER